MRGFAGRKGLLSDASCAEKALGRAVVSIAGHDVGKIYFIVGVEEPGQRGEKFLLADGCTRKFASPKAKKPMHVMLIGRGSARVAQAIRGCGRVDDSVIVHELKAIKADMGRDCDQKEKEV